MKGYWNNLRPFEKRVFVGVAAMLFIVFNLWFVFPHFSDWSKVQNRMAAAQKKLGAFRREIDQMEFYRKELAKLEGEGLSVPAEDQSVQFLRALQTQQQASKVNVTSYGRQALRTNQFFLELSQNIGVACGEAELVDFLYNLGSGSSLIRVRDLTLKPDPQRQLLAGQIKLVASYQKKAPARPATPPPTAPAPAASKASSAAKDTKAPATVTPPPKGSTPTNKPATGTSKQKK